MIPDALPQLKTPERWWKLERELERIGTGWLQVRLMTKDGRLEYVQVQREERTLK